MKKIDYLKDEKLACLILLEKYIEEKEEEKAYLLARKIEKINREIEAQNNSYQKRK